MTADVDAVRRRFVVLTALRWLGTGPLAPVLVVLLQDRGLGLGQVGLLLACYSGTTIALELPTGGLADTLGVRPVMVAATVANLAATSLLLVASPATWLLFLAAVLLGTGRALASGPLESWYVNRVRGLDPAADIRVGLARASVAEAIALAVGALVAGVAGRVLAGPLEVDPLTVPVAASVAATAIFLVAVMALLEPLVHPDGARAWRRLVGEVRRIPAVARAGMATVARSAEVSRLVIAMAAGAVPMVVTEVLWQPKVGRLVDGASSTTLWLGILGAGIFAVAGIGSALAPRIAARFGARTGRAVVTIVIVEALAQVGLALSATLTTFALAFLAAYVANGAWMPLHAELLHDRVGPTQRTTIVSTMSMAAHLTNIGAMLTLVPLAAATSPSTSWILGGALAAGGMLVIAGLTQRPSLVGAAAGSAGQIASGTRR